MRLITADGTVKVDEQLLLARFDFPAIVSALETGEDSVACPLLDSATLKQVLALSSVLPLNGCKWTPVPTFTDSPIPTKAEYERWCKWQPKYSADDLLLRMANDDAVLKVAAAANYLSHEPLLEHILGFLRARDRQDRSYGRRPIRRRFSAQAVAFSLWARARPECAGGTACFL